MTRFVLRGLWLCAALLLAVLAIELAPGLLGARRRAQPPPAPVAAGAPVAAPPAAADRAPDWVTVILARPLFNTDRRPVAAAVVAGGAGPADLPRLAGLVVTPTVRYAIFAGPPGGKQIAVAEGGRIGDFTVGRIDHDGVAVTGAGGERLVRPSFAPAGPPAADAGPGPGMMLDPSPSGLNLIRNPPNIPIPAAPKR